jgi:endogenous inhibitor of DNA gyrase (YacG/DUF329 family)
VAQRDRCVHCRKAPITEAWRPFCSQRCKLLDLANWTDGSYRIPGEPVPVRENDDSSDNGQKED